MERSRKKHIFSVGLAAVLWGALTVSAQAFEPSAGQTYVEGRIQDLQTRRINREMTLVAQVRTPNNRTVPVILGSESRLGDLDLQQGDRVEILGRRVRLNDRPAVKAQRIRMEGPAFRTDPGQQQQQPRYQPDRQPRQRLPEPPPRMQGRMRRPPQSTLETSGTIEDFKQVKIYGQDEFHVVAALSTPQGQTRVVDLGPRRQVDRLGIRRGDPIRVRGVPGSINNNPIVAALEVQADGQWLTVNRTWNRRDLRVRGQVTSLRTVTLPNDDRPHVLATIRNEQGRQVTVDLGRRSLLDQRNVRLSRGQRITLIAEPVRIGNRQILRATKISMADPMMQRTI